MTNQASEDETTKSKVDWSTPYDEWLLPTLNRFRYGGAIECRAIPSEIQLDIESIIRTEKLKLLDEVRERVIGENDRGTITDPDSPSYGEPYESTTADKEELRAELTKLEAEL